MMNKEKIIRAIFWCNPAGEEPVRTWLKELSKKDRRLIGEDIKTVEFAWPVGMPTCRPITKGKGLWEVRTNLTGSRIARVLFYISDRKMCLLHGLIKKTQTTPKNDLDLAMKRKKEAQS